MTTRTPTRRHAQPDTEDNELVAAYGPASDQEDTFSGATDTIDLNAGRVPAKQGPVEATRPDPEQSQYWKNVQTPPVNDTVKQPERRPGKPDDRFRVLSWPRWDNVPLGRYANRLTGQEMPLPEEMSRAELAGIGVDVLEAVRGGYLQPLSEDSPEQPWLTADAFSATFTGKYSNDPVGRLESVFAFLRQPQRHELSWRIPSPVPANYVRALTETLKPTAAGLKATLQELDDAHPATQALAFNLLKRSVIVATQKPAQNALPLLQKMLTHCDDWDVETLRVLISLWVAANKQPSKIDFGLCRRLQRHDSPAIRTAGTSAEYDLYISPRL